MININTDSSNIKAANTANTPVAKEHGASRIIKASDMSFTLGSVSNDMSDYNSQLKSKEDIMKAAGAGDVATARKFMTVMSNTLSDEDYARMVKDGFDPGDTDVETGAGVVDEIKAKLAEAGIIVAGYNDDLSRDELREITGSEALAAAIETEFAKRDLPMTETNVKDVTEAVKRAESIEAVTDGMCDYILRNGIEPTLDYLYRVRFSGAQVNMGAGGYIGEDVSGYYSCQANAGCENLEERIKETIKSAGLTPDEFTMNESRFIIESGIVFNEDNLCKLHSLWQLNPPFETGDVVSAAADAILAGRKAGDAILGNPDGYLERAIDIDKDVREFTDSDVEQIVSTGRSLTIDNLRAAHAGLIPEAEAQPGSVNAGNAGTGAGNESVQAAENTNPELIHAKRVLLETKLSMTVQSNFRMLKLGISVETTALSEVVNTLKALEDRTNVALFGNGSPDDALVSAKASLFKETKTAIIELPLLPAAAIGDAVKSGENFTVGAVYKAGVALKQAYEAAMETYETVGTEVRSDLGDSIRKAFSNVDSLLEGIGMTADDASRRAVRILGYNSMEITETNVLTIKSADAALSRVMNKMTPGAVLELIRSGVNPLETDMETLENKLDGLRGGALRSAGDFADFLYRLESKNGITEKERDSYIGIYRLLNSLEKTDGAALGSLIGAGNEINFKNLLTAVRTGKSAGLDVTLDESFGAKINEAGYKFSISDQILKGFTELVTDDELLSGSVKEKLNDLRESLTGREEAAEELMHYHEPVTPDNLAAFGAILENSAAESPWETLRGAAGGRTTAADASDKNKKAESDETQGGNASKAGGEIGAFEEALAGLRESFTDKESVMEGFKKAVSAAEDVVAGTVDRDGVTRLDIRAAASAFKQIRLMGRLSSEENYEVPVNLEGKLTGMRVKILHKTEGAGNVMTTLATEKFGEIMAQFSLRDGEVDGIIAGSSEIGLKAMEENIALKDALADAGFETGEIRYIYSETLDTGVFYRSHTGNDKVTTKDLYKLAGALIGAVNEA